MDLAKRPAQDDPTDTLSFVCLGAGNEVGRSCHIISYMGKTVMLDAGVHPAYDGLASLPFYDEYDLSKVDILLISHFHLDHAASLPYVMQHTSFNGRVFMTHPTKAIYRWILGDFVRVSGAPESVKPLYSAQDLEESFARIETVDFHSTMEVSGIKFTAYHAGHVLGAAMYLVEIGGVKTLFTGDYSREDNRHLHQAEVPQGVKPDILITESTYGTGIHQPRLEKEAKLKSLIHSTINKGGRCLLPTFALGSAQEILLILEEYWAQNPELQNITIYYASSLARKCMAVYQTYIHMMNDHIRKKFQQTRTNPFQFKYIKSIRGLDRFEDIGPCVMLASPGMLQSGFSRQLLERWAPDPKNCLIITGYSVEGTMAKQIITEPLEIVSYQNPDVKIPRRMAVEELSFAAHVDYQQNSEFIDLVNAPHIILVHGEFNNMSKLRSALHGKYADRRGTDREVKIYTPRNCLEVEIPFKSIKIARTIGKLAELPPEEGQIISGVVVEKDFQMNLLDTGDLREYSSLTTSRVFEKQTVVVEAGPELILFHLQQMFGVVEILDETKETCEYKVMQAVKIVYEMGGGKPSTATIEWEANIMNDAIADSVLAVLLSVDSSPASVKMSSTSCSHDHEHIVKNEEKVKTEENKETVLSLDAQRQINRVSRLMKAQFGDCYKVDGDNVTIEIDGKYAKLNFNDVTVVESNNEALRQRVIHVIERAVETAAPLSTHSGSIPEEVQPAQLQIAN